MNVYLVNNEYYVIEENKQKAIARFGQFSNDKIIKIESVNRGMVVWKGDAKAVKNRLSIDDLKELSLHQLDDLYNSVFDNGADPIYLRDIEVVSNDKLDED